MYEQTRVSNARVDRLVRIYFEKTHLPSINSTPLPLPLPSPPPSRSDCDRRDGDSGGPPGRPTKRGRGLANTERRGLAASARGLLGVLHSEKEEWVRAAAAAAAAAAVAALSAVRSRVDGSAAGTGEGALGGEGTAAA